MKKFFSDSVHDAIGNDLVLDQFDTSYPASFYGSTQDDYITGSLLVQKQLRNPLGTTTSNVKHYFNVTGSRGRLFSKLNANSQPALDSTFGSAEVQKNPSYAERLVPWREKVGNSYRVAQCFDESERIYDSCLPELKNCFSADDCTPWTTYDNPQFWLSPYGNIQHGGSTGYMLFNAKPIASNGLSNDVWTWSFPYEDRYQPSQRNTKSSVVFNNITTDTSTNWYPLSFEKLKKLRSPQRISTIFPLLPGSKQILINDTSFRVDPSLPANSQGSYRILIPSDINLGNKSTPNNEYLTGTMTNDDMVKFLFGFGDLNNITYTAFTLNEDEDDEEQVLSSSYFTGFELQDWLYDYNPPISYGTTVASSSINGSPIPVSGTAPNYFNAQFDLYSGPVQVKWITSPYLGAGAGSAAKGEIQVDDGTIIGPFETYTGYVDYPWILNAREGYRSTTFGDDEEPKIYNFLSQSTYYSYSPTSTLSATGQILTGTTGIYWNSGSSPSRQWILGSFLSSSFLNVTVGDDVYLFTKYKLPEPPLGGKSTSTQKVEITSSLPWKLAYQRAVSAQSENYFRTSFSSMPGFSSSETTVDIEIEKLYGTDVPFEVTKRVETTPQVLTDFTSSLYPPGEYRVNFSYVKLGVTGSTNQIDRAFIDNVQVLTFGDNQLTATFDPNYRIGYSHYPEFRQIIRDTRTSPYFPGTGLKSITSIYKDIKGLLSALDTLSTSGQRNLTVSSALSTALNNNVRVSTGPATTSAKYNQVNINYTPTPTRSNAINPFSTAATTTANFNINPSRISTINRISTVTGPETLARLSVLDEAARYLKSNSYGGYEVAISPVIRGWKYGIYNGFPAHSKMVFRRNRYGQFRDMLEQRIFTKFFNSTLSSIDNPLENSRPTRAKRINLTSDFLSRTSAISKLSNKRIVESSLQEGPVSVKFVSQNAQVDTSNLGMIITTEVSPTETSSQNISKEAVSSVPYFDGESKNRPESSGPGSGPQLVLTTSAAETLSAAALSRNLTITTRPTSFSLTNSLNTSVRGGIVRS